METVYISENAYPDTLRHISSTGAVIKLISHDSRLGKFTGDHPDLRLAAVGGRAVFSPEEDWRPDYPGNAAFCAVVLDGVLLHRLDLTSPRLLEAAAGYELVNVRQGYAKCSSVTVDGRSLITSDPGICRAAVCCGLDVLRVEAGGVLLPGYPEGFLGGATGRVRDEIVFNGSLEAHPDRDAIRAFIKERGLGIWEASGLPLRDIGSIIYTYQ